MNRFLLCFFLTAMVVAHSGVARADLDVVATVPTLAALAKEIGKGHTSVTALALPSQDPHFVDAKPSLALKLRDADLLLAVGLQLEVGWLPTLQTGSRNGKILVGSRGYLECSNFARLKEVPQMVDRSQGDIHPGGNPHYLYDPRQLVHVAIGVAGRMAELDPDNAKAYQDNLKVFLKKLHTLEKKLAKRMKPREGTPVVTYHRSWTYLIDWLGFDQVATLEPKPGIPPSPAHVAKVLGLARQKGVKLIIQESYYPDETGKLVAEKAGAKLVVLPGGVDFAGGESLFDHLEEMVTKIEKAFP
jgi:zinc/manganese transport system substrate-binding protein